MKWADGKIRCCWANPKNERYICYHDEEWGVPVHDDQKLFEMLILECFQAGLSWECVLNKRDAFRKAFDGFDLEKICAYHEDKLEMLRNNPEIIRNRLKIQAAVINAQAFRKIQKEYGSFSVPLALDRRKSYSGNRKNKFGIIRYHFQRLKKVWHEICGNYSSVCVSAGHRCDLVP